MPRAIRAVTATTDGRILCGADDSVLVFDADGSQLDDLGPVGAVVHCLTVLDNEVFVGTAKGMLLRDKLDGTGGVWEVLHRGLDSIESVQARRWNDLVELVIPDGARGVCGVYGDEGVVAKLLETTTPIRRAWACDDIIVALNHHRDRLVVMNANSAQHRGCDVHVRRLTGRSVQDACLVVRTAAPQMAAHAPAPNQS